METGTFDRLSKFLGVGTNRRGAIKAVVAGALGGAGIARVVTPAAATDAPGEEWVQLFEGMAAEVRLLDDDCEAVSQRIQDYRTLHGDDIERMLTDTDSWSEDQRIAHQDVYHDRIQDASIAVYMALTRCGYKAGSVSPISVADFSVDGGLPGLPATPAGTSQGQALAFLGNGSRLNALQTYPPDYCDDGCNPGALFTVANCILWSGDCAFGGGQSAQACCWADICVSGFDHAQCVQTCLGCLNLS